MIKNPSQRRPNRIANLAAAALLLSGTMAVLAPAAHAARGFCCNGENNQKRCGDVLPEICRNRPYVEYNEAGVPVRKVAAPLSEAQQAVRDAEEKKKQAQANATEQQQRADQALLSTYADERDLNTARDRAVTELERSVKSGEQNIIELNKTQAKLAADAAAFKGKTLPFDLKRKITRNDTAIAEQQTALDFKRKEVEETKAKFEGFRKRLQELKAQAASDKS